MKFCTTALQGAFVVRLEPHPDSRGYFARAWCSREFAARGLPPQIVQTNISRNTRRGTLRGMHLQLPPSREGKLVGCLRGAICDVIIDLRPTSPTYLRHFAVELTAESHDALYVPPMMAHGFQTLVDDTEVLYQMTDYHAAELAYGVRWNDAVFGIRWPVQEDIVIVPRDAGYPDFDPEVYEDRIRAAHAIGAD